MERRGPSKKWGPLPQIQSNEGPLPHQQPSPRMMNHPGSQNQRASPLYSYFMPDPTEPSTSMHQWPYPMIPTFTIPDLLEENQALESQDSLFTNANYEQKNTLIVNESKKNIDIKDVLDRNEAYVAEVHSCKHKTDLLENELNKKDKEIKDILDGYAALFAEVQNLAEKLRIMKDRTPNTSMDGAASWMTVDGVQVENWKSEEEISWRGLLQGIQEVTRCGICLEQMQPPVVLCANGHGMCSQCKGALSQCCLCSAAFLDTRVRVLDQILELLPRPCKHSDRDCEVFLDQSLIRKHEQVCQYRPIKCMIGDGESCLWTGSLLTWEKHVKDNHFEEHWGDFDLDESIIRYYNQNNWETGRIVFSFDSQLFLIFSSIEAGKLVQSIRFVPKQTLTHFYYFDMSVEDESNNVILKYRMKVRTLAETEAIGNDNSCISFPIEAYKDDCLRVEYKVSRRNMLNDRVVV